MFQVCTFVCYFIIVIDISNVITALILMESALWKVTQVNSHSKQKKRQEVDTEAEEAVAVVVEGIHHVELQVRQLLLLRNPPLLNKK